MTLFFSIGIAVGLLFFELTGITAGGIVVPGYIALFARQPLRILATLATAFVAFGLGRLLFRTIIAYGRRRFALMLLLGIGVSVLADWALFDLAQVNVGIHAIGLLIPGIIASEMERQGVGRTLIGLSAVSLILYLITFFLPHGMVYG